MRDGFVEIDRGEWKEYLKWLVLEKGRYDDEHSE